LRARWAAIRAGYSAKTARKIGSENLTKPDIAAAITKGRLKQAERAELTGDMVIEELRRLAFANLGHYFKAQFELDPFQLTLEQTAALQEVTVDIVGHEGEGDDARAVRRIRFKLAEK
jgi:phage terminase small subunit